MAIGVSTTDLPIRSSLDELIGDKNSGAGMETVRVSATNFAAQVAAQIALDSTPVGVQSKDLSTPPGSPTAGQMWIVKAVATGAWTGHENSIATWDGAVWTFIAPSNGYVVNVLDIGALYYFNGGTGAWTAFFADTLFFATWAALAAVTGTKAGQAAQVFGDAGTHTDPVVGGSVSNSGIFSWSTSPAGWRRLADNSVTNMAPLASPAFTGTPTAPKPPHEDYSTQIPTTSSVADENLAELVTVQNLVTNSEQVNTYGSVGVTFVVNSAVGPDGLTNMDKVVEDGTTGGHYVSKTLAAAPVGTRVTMSWYVIPAEKTRFRIAATNGTHTFAFVFDTVDKTVIQVGLVEDLVAEFHEVSTGLFRCSVSFIVLDGVSSIAGYFQHIDAGNNTSYTGTIGNGAHVGYFQTSYNVVPVPHVSTGGSPVTKTFAPRKPYIRRYTANSNGFGVVDDTTVCYIIAGGGQSNQDGQGTDAIVASTPLYPGQALMPGGSVYGPRIRGSVAGFSDLYEVITGGSRESACAGWSAGIISQVATQTGKNIRVAAFTHALGATPYEKLKRGGLGDITPSAKSYRWFLQGLEDSAFAARSNGWRPVFLAYNWMGNEANFNTTGEQWATFMCQNYRNMDEDIRRITGQTENWVYFIDSIRYVGAVANASAFIPTIHEGNRLATQRHPYIKLGNPIYQRETNADPNSIHMNCVGQNRRGQALARAVCTEMFGTGWEPFTARKAYRSGASQITVEFQGSMAGNLVMDTTNTIVTSTGLPAGNYYGFRFDDNSGAAPTITGHSISGRNIAFTLSGAPTGYYWRLAYATERNPGVTTDGPVTGARGCLRMDTAYASLYGQPNDYDWCHPFIIDIPQH